MGKGSYNAWWENVPIVDDLGIPSGYINGPNQRFSAKAQLVSPKGAVGAK
jgi:hypothetical protein